MFMYSKYLLLNGALVLLMGILSGIPYWLTIIRRKEQEAIYAWRVAHSFLVMDGLMMLMVGLIIPDLPLDEPTVWVMVWALIISGYGFVLAFIIGAWKGYRGLTPKPYGMNTFLFGWHIIGILGSLIGILIVIYGLFKAFLE
jgi:hypothetical protein